MTSFAIAWVTNPGLLCIWCLCNSLANLIPRGNRKSLKIVGRWVASSHIKVSFWLLCGEELAVEQQCIQATHMVENGWRQKLWTLLWLLVHGRTLCPGFLRGFLSGSCSRGNSIAEWRVSRTFEGKWIHLIVEFPVTQDSILHLTAPALFTRKGHRKKSHITEPTHSQWTAI